MAAIAIGQDRPSHGWTVMSQLQMDAYILDSLMPDLVGHDRRPSAFITYLFLWRQASRASGRVQVSLRDIADGRRRDGPFQARRTGRATRAPAA